MEHSARRINALAARLGATSYLEIGVSRGLTFRDVRIERRTGVDPRFLLDVASVANPWTRLVAAESDAFFAAEPVGSAYDIVYIDGLHHHEQVIRDFTNAVLHTHRRSAILLDDTLPCDVYSALRDHQAAFRHRAAAGGRSDAWHGDAYRAVLYIHDFWPGMNFRTITGSGNPQTLVWRAAGVRRTPRFGGLEAIARLDYFGLHENMAALQCASEEEAIALCAAEIGAD